MEERPRIWRVAGNILNKQSRTAYKERSRSLGFGRGANNSSPRKRIFVTIYSQTKPRTWAVLWYGNLREKDHFVDPGVDGKIILRRIFEKWYVGVWTELSWIRIETGGGNL
jgi:hypothetical protein